MISKNIRAYISNNSIKMSEDITVYTGDGDIDLSIKLVGLSYKIDEIYNDIKILKQDNKEIITDRVKVVDNIVKLNINKNLIDEALEVGEFKIQIRLWDAEIGGNRIALPPFIVKAKEELQGEVTLSFIVTEDNNKLITEDNKFLILNSSSNNSIKISELEEATELKAEDFTVLVQDNTTKKIKTTYFKNHEHDNYATKEDLNNKVDKAEGKSLLEDTEIARLKTLKNYNDTEIKGLINNKSDKTHTHNNYAATEHTHSDYAANKHTHDDLYSKLNHNHNSNYEPVIAEKKTAFNKDFGTSAGQVAEGNHAHAGYAAADHNHDNVYSKTNHNHDGNYAKKSEVYTKLETDNKISEEISKAQISGGEVDLSAYATKEELNAKADKTSLHEHTNKTTLDKITEGKLNNWDSAFNHGLTSHAPSNAQKNSDITKAEIEAKLTGNIESHNHNTLYEPLIAVKKSAFNKDFGTGVGQVAEGNHTHEGYAATGHTHEVIDNLTSTSTTVPLSANQGKILKEKVDEVFQSVSNGKTLIASAITDKGVETSNTDTFEQMATNISNIQGGNGNLTEGELEEAEYWKTQKDWSYRFYKDKRTEIPLLDTSNVSSMVGAFSEASNLKKISFTDTTNVLNMRDLFSYTRITEIEGLDTSRTVTMAGMFSHLNSGELSIQSLDISSTNDINSLFSGSQNLTRIPTMNTANIVNMRQLFRECKKITEVPLLDTTSVQDMSDMFFYCDNLTHIRFNPNASNIVDFSISSCKKMTREDIVGMFESLPTISKSVTIKLGTTLLEKLTEEDKLIAINKGYTLA